MIASLSRGSLLDEVLHGSFNEQQLAAYVSWVNSQLKRKPDLKPITDLRHDLQDGVVLTQLIEIVAGEVLEGIFVSPQNKEESRKNVEQVLQFISSRHIRMPHISAPDIVDGNLKSVMRIILALAAHFKPSANHRSATLSGRSMARGHAHNPLSTVALAQGAAAALASARFDAAQPSRVTRIHSGFGLDVEKNVCVRALVQQYERGSPDEHDSLQTNSSVSSLSHPRGSPSSHSHTPEEDCPEQQSSSQFCPATHQQSSGQFCPATHQQSSGQFCPATHQQSSAALSTVVETTWEDSVSEALEKEVQETRRMVSALQNLLLHGSLPEDEKDVFFSLDQCNSEQQLIVIRSRLDQSMDEAQELKRELLRCKQELRNLQGVKVAQQQRLCTQEASILQMKQELLRASMTKDELNSQNAELQWKLEECNRLFSECKKETGQKDRLLQQLKHKLEESLQQQSELQRELQHISTSTENNGCSYSGNPAPSLSDAEEVQLLRDALRSLRNNFRDHDPQHHTLDTLEQGIASLMDRVHVLHTHRGRGKSPRHKGQHTDSDTKIPQSHGSGSSGSTKILYFTGKSPTPSMITIPKRLGEVTLKDVKSAVDQEGNYRYHFKALDPEFGTVKEEVYLDGATVPGWEGKIVAWVEEDCGDERPL